MKIDLLQGMQLSPHHMRPLPRRCRPLTPKTKTEARILVNQVQVHRKQQKKNPALRREKSQSKIVRRVGKVAGTVVRKESV